MSLKSIIRAGQFGAAVRELIDRHRSLANRITAESALLPTLMLRAGAPAVPSAPAPDKPALSGGAVLDGEDVATALRTLLDAVAVPTDAELDAAGGGLLSAADRDAVRDAIRSEAVLRAVAEATAAALPPNDV